MYHNFVYLNYIKKDGLIASYYPDFIVKISYQIYLVETKAEKDLDNENVLSKEKSALSWIKKINSLKPEDRMHCIWYYVTFGRKDILYNETKWYIVKRNLNLQINTIYH